MEDDYWFMNTGHLCGGIAGVIIAVSSMQRSMNFYTNILNTKTGNTYHFLYDQGYMVLDNDFYMLVKKDI